jgi:hypothetical protein
MTRQRGERRCGVLGLHAAQHHIPRERLDLVGVTPGVDRYPFGSVRSVQRQPVALKSCEVSSARDQHDSMARAQQACTNGAPDPASAQYDEPHSQIVARESPAPLDHTCERRPTTPLFADNAAIHVPPLAPREVLVYEAWR